MRTIYKYPLWQHSMEGQDKPFAFMPQGATVLTAADQHGVPTVWAEVDTNAPMEDRYFEVFGTGRPMYDEMGVSRRYVGTCLPASGLVWHVYERLDR